MTNERVCGSVIDGGQGDTEKSKLFSGRKKKRATTFDHTHQRFAIVKLEEGSDVRMRRRPFLAIQRASSDRMPKQNMNALYHRRALALVAILFAGAIVSQAQSGRRSTGVTTTTPPPSVSGSKTAEKKPEKPPRLQLLVGIDNRDAMSNIPYYVPDTVIDNCVRHLGDAVDVVVTSAGRGFTRAEAIKRAREESARYVVLLQIGSELADSGKQPSKNSVDELYVSYIIFEPGTGKQKQSGRSHHQIYQTGRGGVSTPQKNSPLYSEYALKQAARETAERILEAFEIRLNDNRIMR